MIFFQFRLWLGFIVAMLLHLILGWAWSIGGGIAVGLYRAEHAWIVGGIATGLSWAAFVIHAFIVAPEPTQRLMDIMGALFGGIPSGLVPVATILVGIIVGSSGGAFGAAFRPLIMRLFQS
ncbi:MAG: hypothetical protein OXE59_03135 [Bacteroidetes bacterium]|nr:hypothetical protein [Bacteroidota bacterium]